MDLNSYGLVNYWPIQNSSINDYAGSSHMIYGANNTLCPDRFNNPNSALNFASGYNSIPSGVYFNSDFTATAWINYNQFSTFSKIFEVANIQNQLVSFFGTYSSNNCPGFAVNSVSSPTYCTDTLQTGQWYHVAVTLCGTTGKLYLDGNIKSQNTNTERPVDVLRTINYIGKGNSPTDPNLNAKIDELRIYNRCMSQNEIMNLMKFSNLSPEMYMKHLALLEIIILTYLFIFFIDATQLNTWIQQFHQLHAVVLFYLFKIITLNP